MNPNWIITFSVRDNDNNIKKGCAVVNAVNAGDAQSTLLSSGIYNGNPSNYTINSIEQIFESAAPLLLCEQIND